MHAIASKLTVMNLRHLARS